MSVEGAGPRSGSDTGVADTVGTVDTVDTVVPEGRDDVRGISDLTLRILTPYLSSTALHRTVLVLLTLMTLACVVAAPVRLSGWPLLPLPVLALAFFALHKVRAAGERHRPLLRWSSTLAAATLFGLWLISVMGRWVS